MSNAAKGRILKRADPSTIQDKFLVGYQGWFTCAGDGEPVGPGHHGWLHWFDYPIPDGGQPNTDVWPDVSSYSPSELFPAPGLNLKSGEQAFLFSSRHPKTVQRHFNWMAQHGIDGAFLQRFAGQCDLDDGDEGIRRIRDEVGDRVKEAAEKEGRVYAIMYDVTGVAPDRIQKVLEHDWIHLIREKGVLDSPNYLKEKGKPVIALWGFGFDNAGHSPNLVRAIVAFIRNATPGGAYVIAGTPAHWRSSVGDADKDPDFLNVWLNEFDAISPWTVGRYANEDEADKFAETNVKGDAELLRKRNEEGKWRKVDYMPVVLPGGSGYNMSQGNWGFNAIRRNGGKFLWQQISNVKRQGVRTIYGAMWDEYDEGTALMPIVEKKRLLPQSDKYPFMALDEDGYDLPSDWYMRICGFAAEGLRSERLIHSTFPVKELQDYWSTRPRYEDADSKMGDFVSGSSGGAVGSKGDGQSYQDWLSTQKDDKDELPPPPYSLEAEAAEAEAANQAAARPQTVVSSESPVTSPPQPAVSTRPISPQRHGPPAVNASTRPQPSTSNSLPPLGGQQIIQPSISSLTDDFSRQNISNPAGPQVTTPPLHPTHPAAQRPPAIPTESRPSNSNSGQNTVLSSPVSSDPQGPRPWSQAQWPPTEWKVNKPPQHPSNIPYQPYRPQHQSPGPGRQQGQYPGGADLGRPSSHSPYPGDKQHHGGADSGRPSLYSASPLSASPPPLRPHPSASPTPAPHFPQQSTFGHFPSAQPQPQFSSSSQYSTGSGSSYSTGSSTSSYSASPSPTSLYPEASTYTPPTGATPFPSGPGPSYGAPSPFPSGPSNSPPLNAGSPYGHPQDSSIRPMPQGPQFPQAGGGDWGYYNNPQQPHIPHAQQPSYQPPATHQGYPQPSIYAPYPGPGGASWYPGGQSPSPPFGGAPSTPGSPSEFPFWVEMLTADCVALSTRYLMCCVRSLLRTYELLRAAVVRAAARARVELVRGVRRAGLRAQCCRPRGGAADARAARKGCRQLGTNG